MDTPIILIIICSNILFLVLGYYMGTSPLGQALPTFHLKKDPPYEEIDPYTEAMKEPEEERKETIT